MLGKASPEHKLKRTPYSVAVHVTNGNGEIALARCYGCAAQQGGCKHVKHSFSGCTGGATRKRSQPSSATGPNHGFQ